MKVCFLLQRRFAYVGHQIAINLKEDHGITDFCGYVYLRSSYNFLKEQKDINYSSLLLDQELHEEYKNVELDHDYILWLEKEYGYPNLWPYLELDRVIRRDQLVREHPYDTPRYNHEEMMKMVQVRAKAIIEMLEREKPDLLFCSVVGGVGSMLLYQVAKKMGIKVLFVLPSRIGEREMVSGHFARFSAVESDINSLGADGIDEELKQTVKKMIADFREKPKAHDIEISSHLAKADVKGQMNFLLPKNLKRYFAWILSEIKKYRSGEDSHDFDYINPINKIKDQISRKIRVIRISLKKIYDPVDDNEDFAFMPLHQDPEIATLLYAPFFSDQLHLIKMVARSLPLHFKLYVKDHPTMVGYRSLDFYKELKKIPNVKIISPHVESYSLINKSKLITTITGTAGWEGIVLKKPVITFGEVCYNKLSMVKKCTEIEQLPFIVKDQLENFEFNEDELETYYGYVLKHSVELNLEYLWHKESDLEKRKQALKKLANSIIKNFNQ